MTEIKILPTEHAYYGKYPYKITLKVPVNLYKRDIYLAPLIKRIKKTYGKNWKNLPSSSYNYGDYWTSNPAGRKITFFMPDSTMIDYCLKTKKYSKRVTKVHKPVNEKHLEMLQSGTKIKFRKTLFRKKYRYILRFNTFFPRWDSQRRLHVDTEWEAIEKWMTKYLKSQGKKSGEDYWLQSDSYSWEKGIFLKDSKDAAMIRLRHGDDIKRIESVILESELLSENNA